MDKTKEVASLMDGGTFWFPEGVSTFAKSIDDLFSFILYGSLIVFIGMIVATGAFIFLYGKSRKTPRPKKHIVHNLKLELAWTIIPLILMMVVFAWGYKDFLHMSVPPEDAIEIRVQGQKWFWSFEYSETGIKTIGEIVVPVGRAVKLIMSSTDVLHSFFVPNFRVKRDVLPNRYTQIWFEATQEGIYQVFCAEYCGDQHSNMLATVTVLSENDYETWLKSSGEAVSQDQPLDEFGASLYTAKGCNACHSLDGSTVIGPTWQQLYGSERTFTDGTSAVADDNYIRESIVNPQTKIVTGFQPVMPTYSGLLSDRELNAIIEYIKSLK